MGAAALAFAVFAAHYAYYFWPLKWQETWAQYLGMHLALVIMAGLLMPMAYRLRRFQVAAIIACWLMILESGQGVVCSAYAWGSTPKSDLCIEAFGPVPYVITATVCLVLLLVKGRKKS